MKDVASPSWVSIGIRLTLIVMILLLPISRPPNADALSQRPSQVPPPSNDPEQQAYYQWYVVLAARNPEGVIKQGHWFLRAFPDGKYAPFVTKIVNLANLCLNAKRLNTAAAMRTKVKESLRGSEEDQQVLLMKALDGEVGVNERTSSGLTALIVAVANGNGDAVRKLLLRDVDIDATESSNGWTALIYALWSDNHLVLEDLLSYEPKVGIKDKDGWTALDHAQATADFDILLLMSRPRSRGISN